MATEHRFTFFVRVYCLAAAWSFALGLISLLGGAGRFLVPDLAGPRELVMWLPIAPHATWGVIFLVAGVGMLAALGRPWAAPLLFANLVTYTFFSIGLVRSHPAMDRNLFDMTSYFVAMILSLVLLLHLNRRGWWSP